MADNKPTDTYIRKANRGLRGVSPVAYGEAYGTGQITTSALSPGLYYLRSNVAAYFRLGPDTMTEAHIKVTETHPVVLDHSAPKDVFVPFEVTEAGTDDYVGVKTPSGGDTGAFTIEKGATDAE